MVMVGHKTCVVLWYWLMWTTLWQNLTPFEGYEEGQNKCVFLLFVMCFK